MRRTTIVFYAIGALLFGFLSVVRFMEGGTGWGCFFGAIALYDLVRMITGLRAGTPPAAEPPSPFGEPGPDSVTVEVRVTGGDRVAAIRALREAVPGLGLKEGRDVVDAAMAAGIGVLTHAASPGQAARIGEALAASGAGIEVVGGGR